MAIQVIEQQPSFLEQALGMGIQGFGQGFEEQRRRQIQQAAKGDIGGILGEAPAGVPETRAELVEQAKIPKATDIPKRQAPVFKAAGKISNKIVGSFIDPKSDVLTFGEQFSAAKKGIASDLKAKKWDKTSTQSILNDLDPLTSAPGVRSPLYRSISKQYLSGEIDEVQATKVLTDLNASEKVVSRFFRQYGAERKVRAGVSSFSKGLLEKLGL